MIVICQNVFMFQYLRVDESTNMDVMLKILVNGWHLKTPNLLISVTGGAKNFTMKPRLKEVFRRGLMKAAESTGKKFSCNESFLLNSVCNI